MMLELWRRGDHFGSGVRLDVQLPSRHDAAPRVSVDQRRWCWERAVTMRFHQKRHINELELQMVHNALRWRLRHFKALGTRLCLFVDSQATVAIVAYGRSTSHRINAVLSRLNALCLATFVAPVYVYAYPAGDSASAAAIAPWVHRA